MVGDVIRPFQKLQFHVRDEESSRTNILTQMHKYARHAKETGITPLGALVFSCVARGSELYGEADVDALAIQAALPGIAISGMNCNGEIGSHAGSTHMYGFTTVVAVVTDNQGK